MLADLHKSCVMSEVEFAIVSYQYPQLIVPQSSEGEI